MKHLLHYIAFFIFAFASGAWADITTGKYSTAQIFDVQWNVSGNTLNTSGYTRPFYSGPMGSGQMTQSDIDDIDNNGRYFAFFDSVTDPGTYGLAVYSSDGSLYKYVHDTGTFRTLADGAIFYLGAGMWGTLITTAQGFAYGDSASFTVEENYPSNTTMAAWQPDSTEPLADGETASQPSEPETTTPAPVYRSSITDIQQASKDAYFSETDGNNVDLTIIGDSNIVDIEQLSNGNYLNFYLQGNTNTATILQSGTNLDRNFADISVIGSVNTLTFSQEGDSEKTALLNIDGSYGTYDITQQGSGEHFLDFKSTGDDAVVSILQEGLGSHSATVELENAGGNWNFDLTQSGDVDQLYSLPHDLSDNTVVSGVCTTGTCNITINQQ